MKREQKPAAVCMVAWCIAGPASRLLGSNAAKKKLINVLWLLCVREASLWRFREDR
jgi:hypothetical protein